MLDGHTDVKQPFYSDTHLLREQTTLKPAHTYTHRNTHIYTLTRTRVTGRVGERGLEKQGGMKSVFESKQRQSDQDQIGADQTVVLEKKERGL